MNDLTKNLLLWFVIAAVLVSLFKNFAPETGEAPMDYSQFIQAVQQNQVKNVEIDGLEIRGKLTSGKEFATVRPRLEDPQLINDLLQNQVSVKGVEPQRQSIWMQLLVASFPILIIIAVFMLFMRNMQGGMGGGKGGPMSFGKSKAKLLSEDQIKTTFADVAGCDEAKEDVQEIVDFLKDPGKFQRLGGQMPRGVLMVGPPGTGKTLLAKAVAGEAKVPFFSISGSDFVEMFVGVGASRVRDMFEQAKKQAPCIVFIDEIDAVGRHRGSGMGGNDEREQTLNQLLVEMDGFEGNEGVIVIAATNRADVLDTALLRPGRFDRQVVVGLPDIRGREQILKVHMRKVPLADDVDAAIVARGTPGFSGAELANLVNESALFAARSSKRLVSMAEFEKARDKIMMGAERKTLVMSEKEKEATAYHESGHTIVGYLSPEHDPIHKVTIIPRGRALGVTHFLPEADRISESKRKLLGQLATLYGGRIAEELIYGADGVSTGASSDINMATRIARGMVSSYGLSDKLGPIDYEATDNSAYGNKNISSKTASLVDEEVKAVIDECYADARRILEENIDILHSMTKALVEYETLDADQVGDLMKRQPVRKPKDWDNDDNQLKEGDLLTPEQKPDDGEPVNV